MPPPTQMRPGKRMTANPVKPARYRPGKAVPEAESESEEEVATSDSDRGEQRSKQATRAPPKATSFPSGEAKKISQNLKSVDLNQRWRDAETQERRQKEEERRERERMEREAGFVTESESGSGSEADESDEDRAKGSKRRASAVDKSRDSRGASGRAAEESEEDEEESSSEEDESDDSDGSDTSSSSGAPKKLLRPVFIRKDQRKAEFNSVQNHKEVDSGEAEAAALARRQAQTDAMVQEKLELDAIARAAGKKAWDDDEPGTADFVDDTDDLDPELEQAEWVARELARLKRARQELEEREAELAEIERRRGLTAEEREREDQELIEKQKAERKDKGQMAHMQRYHHRGAFFVDDAEDRKAGTGTGTGTGYKELAERDLMGARYQDQDAAMSALPAFLQVRDVTKIGRKGRTKYKDLKSEDTGTWADYGGKDSRRGDRGYADVCDDRFRPDAKGPGADGPTGANASKVGDRYNPDRKRGFQGSDGRDGPRDRDGHGYPSKRHRG